MGEESVTAERPSNVGPDQGQTNLLPAPVPDEDAQEVGGMSGEGVGLKTLDELVTAGGLSEQSRLDMGKNPVSYEDAQEAVNSSVDEVGAKQQKETREQKPHGPPAKKKRAYIPNTVIHVEHGEKSYIWVWSRWRPSVVAGFFIGASMSESSLPLFCRWALSLFFGSSILCLAHQNGRDFRLVAFAQEMPRTLEQGFEGQENAERRAGKAPAVARVWGSGPGHRLSEHAPSRSD